MQEVLFGFSLTRSPWRSPDADVGSCGPQAWSDSLPRFGALLIVFYLSSSKVTRVGSSIKSKLEKNHAEGGSRDSTQVLSNSLPAVAAACLYCFAVGDQDLEVDYQANWLASAAHMAAFVSLQVSLSFVYVASLSRPLIRSQGFWCSCNGDTWSSELGILSSGEPFLITNPTRRVPKGTNGGVSMGGLLAAVAAGALLGVTHWSLGLLLASPVHQGAASPHQGWLIVVGALAGLTGSLIDSVLGATLQVTWFDASLGMVVPERNPSLVSGKRSGHLVVPSASDVLSNDGVNLVSGIITALLTAVASSWFF
jgi:uncharacterized membrane protein